MRTDLVMAGTRRPATWDAIRVFILKRDGHRCYVCGGAADEVDHLWPRRLGGDDHQANLAAVCGPCNKHKGGKALPEYLTHRYATLAATELGDRIRALLEEMTELAQMAAAQGEDRATRSVMREMDSVGRSARSRFGWTFDDLFVVGAVA
jgi:hypothetical protein